MRRRLLGLALPTFGVALIALTLNTAMAQQPVRMLYGFAAGGSGDLAARLLADVASKELGQRVVVENRTGANGMIAAEGAARGPTDGSNVLFCTTGNMTIVTELPGAQLPINPATDLIGIGQLLRSTFGLVVSKDSPYRSVQDLVADARANPGKVTCRPNSWARRSVPRWCTCRTGARRRRCRICSPTVRASRSPTSAT